MKLMPTMYHGKHLRDRAPAPDERDLPAPKKKQRGGLPRFTQAEVNEIFALLAKKSQKAIAAQFGCGVDIIRKINNGEYRPR